MAVLRDRTCEKDRERNSAGREKGHEDEMRTRFRDYAYERGEQDHKRSIVAYPSVYLNVLQPYPEYQKHTECPCEYGRQMLSYYMVPHMVFHEMVRRKEKHEKDDHAQSREKDVHPSLVKEVDGRSCGLFMVVMSTVLSMYMAFVVMIAVMRAVVMAKMAGCKGCDESSEADEHQHPLPSVMAFMALSVFVFSL